MPARKKYTALGRGLDALIQTDNIQTEGSSSISAIDLSLIHANPNQPRREFDEAALQELSDSICELGVIQPITLRQMDDGTYQIIAGERRFRASQMAGLQSIPAYIRTASDESVLEMALVENLQREDLNAVEIALAYQHLLEQYEMTQERLSERVGKKRSTVTNYLRLLKLPASIQMALKERQIEMGHARALLTLDNPSMQLKVFNEIVRDHLSVRRVEELAKSLSEGESVSLNGQTLRPRKAQLSEEYSMLRDSLTKRFNTRVQLTCSDKGKGKITIPFANEEELERIVGLLDRLN